MTEPTCRLAIDVGGTFVDLVLAQHDASLVFEKVLAEPADLVGSITAGVRALLRRAGASPAHVREVLHATTRGSNIVLERAGPRTALVATRGFRDVLQIQRAVRWSMYDVQLEKPAPLVPRHLAFEVSGRMNADGSVREPLDERGLRLIATRLRSMDVQAVAVAFLHSYANPQHEQAAAAILADELPGVVVTASSDVSLQAREYERANTAVVNAYIAKALSDYMQELTTSLADLGIGAELRVMQSSGGLASVGDAIQQPVRMLESGPAAGVVGAVAFGKAAASEDVISFDMGGTTAKVAVVTAAVPARTNYFELQRISNRRGSGLPVDIAALDLVEIGTGGGSIAEIREGTLRVGPRSAGAHPGPACYGRGGQAASVTDANVVLGYYDPALFAGGLLLDRAAAELAVAAVASQLQVDPIDAAWGIHQVATEDMAHAIRLVSINRGFDPREHALVCTGGAAPAHGSRLARILGCRLAIIPLAASGGSARGLLEANPSTEVTRTVLVRLDQPGAGAAYEQIVRELIEQAERHLSAASRQASIRLTLGIRYVGQGHELMVPAPLRVEGLGMLAERFHQRYEQTYGYRDTRPLEIVTWHLSFVRSRDQHFGSRAVTSGAGPLTPQHPRRAYFPELGLKQVDVHDRARFREGMRLRGPCLIAEPTTTTVVLPDDSVEVAGDLSLLIHIGG